MIRICFSILLGVLLPGSAHAQPKLPSRAAGDSWYCIRSLQFDHLSSCFRTMDQCKAGKQRLARSHMKYSACELQKRAACFTYYDRLKGIKTFDCSATLTACSRQRRYGLQQLKKDVSRVSKCGAVGRTGGAKKRMRSGGRGFFCFDAIINNQRLVRYLCQRRKSDCQKSRRRTLPSMRKTYAQQGRNAKIALTRCKYSKKPAYCSLWDSGYFCAGEEEVCALMTRLAIQSGKVQKASGCMRWK